MAPASLQPVLLCRQGGMAMYVWRNNLGVIGNLKALIADHNSNFCNTENYHAADEVTMTNDRTSLEQQATDSYLDMVQAQQDITDIQLQMMEA
jgi:hypothetical protein